MVRQHNLPLVLVKLKTYNFVGSLSTYINSPSRNIPSCFLNNATLQVSSENESYIQNLHVSCWSLVECLATGENGYILF